VLSSPANPQLCFLTQPMFLMSTPFNSVKLHYIHTYILYSEAIVSQVLDELGVEVGDKVSI